MKDINTAGGIETGEIPGTGLNLGQAQVISYESLGPQIFLVNGVFVQKNDTDPCHDEMLCDPSANIPHAENSGSGAVEGGKSLGTDHLDLFNARVARLHFHPLAEVPSPLVGEGQGEGAQTRQLNRLARTPTLSRSAGEGAKALG